MKLGRYPLMDVFLNGSQVDAAANVVGLVGSVIGKLLRENPVTTDQSDNDARDRIEDQNDDCFDVPPQTTECQAVVNSDLSSLCKTRLEALTDRFGIVSSHTIGDTHARHFAR